MSAALADLLAVDLTTVRGSPRRRSRRGSWWVFADPQVRQARLGHEQVDDTFGPVEVVGLPVTLSRTPATVRTPAPVPGAHTREVLGRPGSAAPEIDMLADAGVIEVTK